MSNFIVAQITPDMLESLKYGTFIFFGLMTFGGGLFIWFYVPETKRLTLEEMDTLFGSVGVAETVSTYFFCPCGPRNDVDANRTGTSGGKTNEGNPAGDWPYRCSE